MKKPTKILTILSLLIIFCACDDILEEDIGNDAVVLIAPAEGDTIEGNTVNFSWQTLDGADNYRIQVLTDNQVFEVDSLLLTNHFEYILNPGDYQWRVRGENFAYQSPYTFSTGFSVVTSNDLSGQNVGLQTPSIDFYTNDTNIIYTWDAIANADSYSFELIKNLNGQLTVFQEQGLTVTNINVDATTYDEDAEYIWKVKAVNASSETPFSERSLFIDREIPSQPNLVEPTDMEITTTIVNFNWTNGTDTGNVQSAIANTVEIASDIDFNTIIQTDSTTNNTYQYTFGSIGTYYWRVKAIDAAGNESDNSIVRTLIVQ